MIGYFLCSAASLGFAASFFLRSTAPKPRPVEVRDDYREIGRPR